MDGQEMRRSREAANSSERFNQEAKDSPSAPLSLADGFIVLSQRQHQTAPILDATTVTLGYDPVSADRRYNDESSPGQKNRTS